MKKRLTIITLFAIICANIWALSFDQLLNQVSEKSSKMATIKLNKANNDLQWEIEDADDKISVTLSSGDVTFKKDKNDKHYFSMEPSIEVVFPDNDEDDDLEFSIKLDNESKFYLSGDNKEIFTPSANLTKTISLDSYQDDREDLTDDMNKLQEQLTYEKNILQFNNTLIENIISIMENDIKLNDSQISYNRLLEDYKNDIASGNLTAGTVKDLERQLEIESAQSTVENNSNKQTTLLKTFKEDYGIDYAEIDTVKDCNLTLNTNKGTNTEITVCEKALEIAKQNYEAEIGIAQKLKIGGSVESPITLENNKETSVSVNGSTFASISGSNYSFGTKVGAEYNISNNDIYPYVTISGKWSNKSTKQADDLEVQTLKNKVIIAEIDYQNAKDQYTSEIRSLSNEITEYNSEKNQQTIEAKYNKQILEKTEQMYNLGLTSLRALEDAKTDVENDKSQEIITALKGIKLENNIAIANL